MRTTTLALFNYNVHFVNPLVIGNSDIV